MTKKIKVGPKEYVRPGPKPTTPIYKDLGFNNVKKVGVFDRKKGRRK